MILKISSKGQFYKTKMRNIFNSTNKMKTEFVCHSKIQNFGNFNIQKLLENNYQIENDLLFPTK